jgi:2'-5' RNA ligase
VSYPAEAHAIGVAIPIPEPFGSELQNHRREFGDPQAEAIPPHITLVPPMAVDETQYVELHSHLEKIAAVMPRFRVHLRGTGTFRPVSPVVFVALAEGISGAERLADAVRRGPVDVDLRFPYHPHVTVAHFLNDQAMDHAFRVLSDYDAVFDAGVFSLYHHGRDGQWRVAHDYELTGETMSV